MNGMNRAQAAYDNQMPYDEGEQTCTCGHDAYHRERKGRECPNVDCWDGEINEAGDKCPDCNGLGMLPVCTEGGWCECKKFEPVDRFYDYDE